MRKSIVYFWRREDAAISTETVIIMPILFVTLILSFTFFDAFRRYNLSLKAAYTIGDILSRRPIVTAWDFEGLANLYEFLTFENGEPWLRYSEVRRGDVGYEVEWSYATDGNAVRDTNSISALLARMPVMAVGERVIVVETYSTYTPPLNIELPTQNFENIIVTRPRFASFLEFDHSVALPAAPVGTY